MGSDVMEIFQIVGLGIVATMISIILKKYKPEISLQVAILTGVIIFSLMVSKLTVVISLLNDIASRVNIELLYMAIILKIIAIAYISEFGAEVCKDAGESTIALKIEFAGKVLILVLAAPIIYALLDLVVKIIP
jgi:stage III sporulation protein AD